MLYKLFLEILMGKSQLSLTKEVSTAFCFYGKDKGPGL
jgi:hypothetical protein